ncbi:MAG: GGDEF domain-containing protein, partial [Rhodoferax sp.]|nr:GGDEF domain-containing protein [Rhodoferax sp.]
MASQSLTSLTLPAEMSATIRPLVGEFADEALELAFRESTLGRVAQQQRISLMVWALLMLAVVVPEYFEIGAVPQFWWLTFYRVTMAAALLAGCVALKRAPTLALHSHLLMWMGLVCWPYFFLFNILRPDIRVLSTATIMMVQLALFIFLPFRVRLALPVALLGTVGATLSVWVASSNGVHSITTAFLVTLPAVVGYVFALRLQKNERHAFWLRRQLQEEIARRIALQDELERKAMTDLLTGLPNRRAFLDRLNAELARAQRSGEALSLAMFDLDHFKQVNDRYGHAAGDAVLRSVGQLCLHSFRGADMAARVGGEEFLVLLPGSTVEQAAAVMTRFVCTLAETVIDIGTQTLQVTATAGVVQQAGESLDALMAHVDAVMYAGKQAGRNRVVLAAALAMGDLSADAVA